jgi:hypothetical protein
MARDFATIAPNVVTRKDREVTDEGWIKALLRRAPVGIIATVHEGQPFINTNLFVYDEPGNAIYMHTAKVGRTRANIEADGRVCFTATEMGRLLPAAEALEFSVEYASVVAFGRASIIEDFEEARRALQMLLDKYAPHLRPGKDYRPPIDEEIKRTSVYRIQIDSWSGKKKEVAPDFPGAYLYSSVAPE